MRHKIENVERFDLNEDEAILIDKYRELNITARKSVVVMIDALFNNI